MKELKSEKRIGIRCPEISEEILAVMEDSHFFENRKEEICARTFGTTHRNHPKIERIMSQGDYLLSGSQMKFL